MSEKEKRGRKRKATADVGLETEEDRLAKHLAIMAKLICGSSDMVDIFVGEAKETFKIHKNLLVLHSGYFENAFRGNDDTKFALPQLKPAIFADFHTWLYSGEFLQIGQVLSTPNTEEERWKLGKDLKAPAFENLAMEAILDACRDDQNHFLYVSDIEAAYKMTKKGDLLRKLAADRFSCENPMLQLKEGTKERKEWEDLIKRCPDLAMDIALGGRNWAGKYPWDDEHKQRYMEKDLNLDEVWHGQILARRSKDAIKTAARGKCFRSIIELAHLDREE